MKILVIKFKVPPSRKNLCVANMIYVEDQDELKIMESLGKPILLNWKRFISGYHTEEAHRLKMGYYEIKSNKVEPEKVEPFSMYGSNKSMEDKKRVRRRKVVNDSGRPKS